MVGKAVKAFGVLLLCSLSLWLGYAVTTPTWPGTVVLRMASSTNEIIVCNDGVTLYATGVPCRPTKLFIHWESIAAMSFRAGVSSTLKAVDIPSSHIP